MSKGKLGHGPRAFKTPAFEEGGETEAFCDPSATSLSRFWGPLKLFSEVLALENFLRLSVKAVEAIGQREADTRRDRNG